MSNRDIELFLDSGRLSSEYNVERRLCRPEKHPGNPIIVSEHPWEEAYVTVMGSVMPRTDGSGLQMWYMSGAKGMRNEQFLCYAESEDGLEWRKVMSEAHPYADRNETNILFGGEANVHGPCVIRNRHNDDPSEKYLLMYDSYPHHRPELQDLLGNSRWCYTATSPDGLTWSPPKGRPAVPGKADCGQSVVWDPRNRRYLAYLRGTRAPHDPFAARCGSETTRVRYVRIATSTDFLHWSDPIELLRADERDGDPNHQIHQLSVTRRGNTYVGLMTMFHVERYVQTAYDGGSLLMEDGPFDTQLVTSRDGFTWNRVANRAVFMTPGASGQWDYHTMVTASHIVFDNDRMLFYYAATRVSRSDKNRPTTSLYRIGVATLPRDRFQAMKPRKLNQPGIIETKPLSLGQGDLRINADAAHGKIVAELCDFNGKTIDGFSRDQCEPVKSDALDQTIRWNGQRLSDAIQNNSLFRRSIRIRLYLHHASLYAIYLPLPAKV